MRTLLPRQRLRVVSEKGQCTVTVPAGRLPEVATVLRADPSTLYEMPVCTTCVDWPERDLRFELVYLLRSLVFNDLAWVSVLASEETEVSSLAEVFPGLEWHERECYALFGVRFVGHPLRKDYVSFGEPVAFTHNIEWALSPQDRPEYMPGATRGAVERP